MPTSLNYTLNKTNFASIIKTEQQRISVSYHSQDILDGNQT